MTDSSEDHLSEEIKKAQELELEEAEAEPLQYTVCDLSSLEEEFNSKKRVLDLACQNWITRATGTDPIQTVMWAPQPNLTKISNAGCAKW